jgi:hypothetical protein
MGLEGVVQVQEFLDAGGLLITLGNATYFPPDFGLVRDVNTGSTSNQFYAPRPIVEAEITRPEHPIFYGYTEKTVPIKYTNGPMLQVPRDDVDNEQLMKFVGGDKAVLSGLMKGAGEIRDRAAIVDVPVGKGRVLLYSTNPVYRWQNHGEFNMLFNALVNFDDLELPAAKKKASRLSPFSILYSQF